MSQLLCNRIVKTIPVIDPAQCERARARIGADVFDLWGENAAFLDGVFASAPYLLRLATRHGKTLVDLTQTSPESLIEGAIARAQAAQNCDTPEAMMAELRHAKQVVHLVCALADLAGAFDLKASTLALSDFADQAIKTCLRGAAQSHGLPVAAGENPVPGLFVLTLGKHGQRSLNYSSDVDLVVYWQPDLIALPDGKDPHSVFPKIAQKLAIYMEELTGEGYVFRVDLRLRPDPSSTPAAVNADMARHYFEAVGQNWERAAYAKARYCAGDVTAAQAFLSDLEPFIWRRTLDYAAVEDIRALAKQIQSVGRRSFIEAGGHDVKLGRGGIREIEFYTQVLQLLFGGRRAQLRPASTLDALGALRDDQLISQPDEQVLRQAYLELRHVEHRIQMLQDEQTQTLPKDDDKRRAVAALMGQSDLAAFDAHMCQVFTDAHGLFSDQFVDGESLATEVGSLVLTGVEPTPDTLKTLQTLGFEDPEWIWQRLSGWAAGRARALRTERARRLFARYAPRLVEALSATGEPDQTLARFASFFEGLPSGVQALSLLVNQPGLSRALINVIGLAPRLGEILARRPALLDVMLDAEFAAPLRTDQPGRISQRFAGLDLEDFEGALNGARRLAREERLRIGIQLLLGQATAEEAGRAYSALADAAIHAMTKAALNAMAERHGPAPGGWALIAFGKHGGAELRADSDLDLVLVYESEQSYSDGEKPLGVEAWFIRFTQRLVSALSAPTEEGDLFEIDLALRPSGSAGPVAVRLSRFEDYYDSDEAWTWERMALTRTRIVAGDLTDRVETAIARAISKTASTLEVCTDAADMRARLERDKPSKSHWEIKLCRGGSIEIEFIAQVGQLSVGRQLSPNTEIALARLGELGVIAADDCKALIAIHGDYTSLSQIIRVSHGRGFSASSASSGFAKRLSRAVGEDDLDGVLARLNAHRQKVRALFEHYILENSFHRDG